MTIYDVTVRVGVNVKGCQVINISRVNEEELSVYLRSAQDKGWYVLVVRRLVPMFRDRVVVNIRKSPLQKVIIDDELEYDDSNVVLSRDVKRVEDDSFEGM